MIRRGDIWWANFPLGIGEEIRKIRPAIVVSNNAFNRRLDRVQVVPLTSKTKTVYPGQVLLAAGDRKAKAMADQIQTVSKQRLINKIGRVSRHDMANIERSIRLQLGLK